jgi:cyanate lyase
MSRPRVWIAAAVLGQHPFSHEEAERLGGMLELPADAVRALEEIPTRGALDTAVPVDPTIYRLYEVLQVYGPALKALIHEDFGDEIMSAINFAPTSSASPILQATGCGSRLTGSFFPTSGVSDARSSPGARARWPNRRSPRRAAADRPSQHPQ